MEETIGYEALFSEEEWADWPSDEELELDNPAEDTNHTVRVYELPQGLEIECERCGVVASTDSEAEAEAVGRLHESFVATLVEKWAVGR